MLISEIITCLHSHEYMSGDTKRRDKGRDEIFTPMPAVNDLLALIKKLIGDENYHEKMLYGIIEDPTAGDGNMLVGSLIEKLNLFSKRYDTDEIDNDDYRVLVHMLRGNDILSTNIAVAKQRLIQPLQDIAGMSETEATEFLGDTFKKNFTVMSHAEFRGNKGLIGITL